MAIDKHKTKQFLKEVDELVETLIPEKYKDTVQRVLIGPALKELEELIDESRPPVFYLVGRSGHGKSSLINALSNQKVAEVGDIKPQTAESVDYLITFPEQYATWRVVDSRGLFETTPPEGKEPIDTTQKVIQDINKYKVDIILHVISAPEVRNLAHDLEVFSKILNETKRSLGVELPVIVVLTKPDTLGNPREWPPKEYPRKAALILELLEYMGKEVLKSDYESLDKNFPYKGILLKNDQYVAVIPVTSLWEDLWNIETLSLFIGDKLPKSALLDYAQAQGRKALLKKISNSLIKRFSLIAGGIGVTPIPVGDIFILTPLQILMIAIIGGLSCRPVSIKTAKEYLTAAGINLGTAAGLREAARAVLKIVAPGLGHAISGAIAAAGTYGIGKAAEYYFFEGVVKKPKEFYADFDFKKELKEHGE